MLRNQRTVVHRWSYRCIPLQDLQFTLSCVLTKCFPLSFCSAFVPLLYYLSLFLHVFSVIILTTGDFSCLSRFFHVPLQIRFIFPSIKIMDSVLIFFSQPSSWLSSFLDQCIFFSRQRQLTVWAQWYYFFFPVFSYLPSIRWTSPKSWGWETGSESLKSASQYVFSGFCHVFCRMGRVFCNSLSCMATPCKTVKTNIAESWKYCLSQGLAALRGKCCSSCA